MSNPKAMCLGAMFVLLVVAVIFLPQFIAYIDRMEPQFIAGFTNPSEQSMPHSTSYQPDRNTNYLCRSPNDNGSPCGEGMFCDGATQSCIKKTIFGQVPDVGYFS